MLPTTPSYRREVVTSHDVRARVRVKHNGKYVATLPAHEGTVEVDAGASHRRSLKCKLHDPTGRWTPRSASDLLNPTVGAILLPERGVVIPEVATTSATYNSATTWNQGTHTDTVVTPDGGLTIG